MKIIKAKITKDNTLIATYVNENGDTVNIEGKNIVHKDLTESFCALIPHLAFLCEQKEADGKKYLVDLPDEMFTKMEVSGSKRFRLEPTTEISNPRRGHWRGWWAATCLRILHFA